jgi:hypothetical protein
MSWSNYRNYDHKAISEHLLSLIRCHVIFSRYGRVSHISLKDTWPVPTLWVLAQEADIATRTATNLALKCEVFYTSVTMLWLVQCCACNCFPGDSRLWFLLLVLAFSRSQHAYELLLQRHLSDIRAKATQRTADVPAWTLLQAHN